MSTLLSSRCVDERDREYFLELAGELHERFGVVLHAYVLMRIHFHRIHSGAVQEWLARDSLEPPC